MPDDPIVVSIEIYLRFVRARARSLAAASPAGLDFDESASLFIGDRASAKGKADLAEAIGPAQNFVLVAPAIVVDTVKGAVIHDDPERSAERRDRM